MRQLEKRGFTLPVRVSSGDVLDVVVDLRKTLTAFGQWVAVNLSSENKRQLWTPEAFAHGFVVLSEPANFLYKTTDYYAPEYESCIRWDDEDLAIDWLVPEVKVSEKDNNAQSFKQADLFE